MNTKLPSVTNSKHSKNENKFPSTEFKNNQKSKKETKSLSKIQVVRSLPINCILTVDEMIKEAVNNLIHEYLLKMNLTKTLEKFKEEMTSSKPVIIENYRDQLRTHFKHGQKDRFFKIWNHYIPISLRMHDKETIKTEFFIMLHFIFYKIYSHEREKQNKNSYQISLAESKDNSIRESMSIHAIGQGAFNNSQNSIEEYRAYLLKNGEEFSKIEDLLPYYALPFLKDPFSHSLFKELLTSSWVNDLGKRLDSVLNSLYSPKSKPYLLQMYESSFKENELKPQNENENVENSNLKIKQLEKTPKKDEESDQKRSFKSFKDKSKTPLMNILAKKQEINDFQSSALNENQTSNNKSTVNSQTENNNNEVKLKFESPSKSIQVKNYIKRIEVDNQRLTDTINLLSKTCEENEKKIQEMTIKHKQMNADCELKWQEKYDRLLEYSCTLFQFAEIFKTGREHFIGSAEEKLNEFKKFTISKLNNKTSPFLKEDFRNNNFKIDEPNQHKENEFEIIREHLNQHLFGIINRHSREIEFGENQK